MTSSPTRLLRRSNLQPGESLPSFLVRLAKLNHYDPPALLEQVCLAGESGPGQASRPDQPATFEQIARLTGVAPTTLYAATAHCFASLFTALDQPPGCLTLPGDDSRPRLGSENLSRHLRPESVAHFCPDCLRTAAYHHLAWLPKMISVCLPHKRFLVEQCPQCHHPVTIRAIVETRCRQCQADLRQACSMPLGRDALGLLAQRVIWSWLMGGPLPDHRLTHLLPDQPPAMLYHLLVGLASSLRIPPTSTSDQRYRLLGSLPKSLLNWPQGFQMFLVTYGRRGLRKRTGDGYVDLDVLYTEGYERQWQHPAFQFVREAFEEYLVEHHTPLEPITPPRWYGGHPVRAERFAYTTIFEAAQQLHTSPEMVQRLGQLGYLVCFGPEGPFRGDRQVVRRSALWRLRRTWHEPLSLMEAAWWLGASVEIVEELVTTHLLIAKRDRPPNSDAQWQINKQSLADLWSTVMRQAHLGIGPLSKLIDLKTAVHTLEVVGVNAADLIKRVATGEVRAYCPLPVYAALDELLFAEQDIRACARVVKAKRRGDYRARKSS
jgi:hypothetical protein